MAEKNHGPRLPLKPPKRARTASTILPENQPAGALRNAQGAGESVPSAPALSSPEPWYNIQANVGSQLAGQRYSSVTNPSVHGSVALRSSAPLTSTSTMRENRASQGTETRLAVEPNSPSTAIVSQGISAAQETPSAPPRPTVGPTQGKGNFLFGVRLPDYVPHPLSGSSAPPMESRRVLPVEEAPLLTKEASATQESQPFQQASSSAAVLPTRPTSFRTRPPSEGPVPPRARVPQWPHERSQTTLSQSKRSAEHDARSKTRQTSDFRGGGGPGASRVAGRQSTGIVSAEISERASSQASRGAAAKPTPRPDSTAFGGATALDKKYSYEEAIRHEFASCQSRIRRWEREMSIHGTPLVRIQTLKRAVEEEESTLKTLERRRQNLDSDIRRMEEMYVAHPGYCGYIKKVQRQNNDPNSRCRLFRKELEKLVRQESTFDNTRFIGQYLQAISERNSEITDRRHGLSSSAPVPSGRYRQEGPDFGRTARDTPVRESASKAAAVWSCATEDDDAEDDPTPTAPQSSDPDFVVESASEISDAEVSTTDPTRDRSQGFGICFYPVNPTPHSPSPATSLLTEYTQTRRAKQVQYQIVERSSYSPYDEVGKPEGCPPQPASRRSRICTIQPVPSRHGVHLPHDSCL